MKKMNKKILMVSISVILMMIITGAIFASHDNSSPLAFKENSSDSDKSLDVAYDGIGYGVYAKNIDNDGKNEHSKTQTNSKDKEPVIEEEKPDSTTSTEIASNTASDSVTISRSSSETERTSDTSNTTTKSTVDTSNTVTSKETPETNPEPAPSVVQNAIYVSTAGQDSNSGTFSSPFRTVQTALNVVQAGQTIYLREGSYNEKVTFQKSGTSGNDITLTSYPGETATINGSGYKFDWSALVNTNGKSFIKIDSINVVNSDYAGIGSMNGGSNIKVTNCSTLNTGASGIGFYYASNITVSGNVIDSANHKRAQEALSLEDVNGFVISNNVVKNGYKEGIDVKNGSSNGVITRNEVYNVGSVFYGSAGIYVDAFSAYQSNIEISYNYIHNNMGVDKTGQGITLAAEVGGTLANVKVHHNRVIGTHTAYSIHHYDGSYLQNLTFDSNLAENYTTRGIRLNAVNAHDVYLTNNTFISSTGTAIVWDGTPQEAVTLSGNIY